jgi:preprotein translocase subunit SecE
MNIAYWFAWPQVLWTLLIASSVALLVWLGVRFGARIRNYLLEVSAELSKCSWPWNPQEKGFKKYKELIDSTVIVAVSSLLLAGYVTSADFILVKVIGFLTRLHV